MNYNDFQNTFIPELNKITSLSNKINFADQNLTKIGSGSGRAVYDIDGEKVFKLAKNTKGIAQNEAESNPGSYGDYDHVLAKMFDYDDNDQWVVSEKADKVNEKRIIELTGIPNLTELRKYLANFVDENNGRKKQFNQDNSIVELLNNNEFVNNLTSFIMDYNQHWGDLGKANTYGEVKHDGQPTIVLTDYGLSDEVYNTHYAPKVGGRIYENDEIIDEQYDMNNKFIDFILKHDKYPDKILPNICYIIQEFENVINNLGKVLNNIVDKDYFYKNLLKLQEYLIKNNLFNKQPIRERVLTSMEKNKITPKYFSQTYYNLPTIEQIIDVNSKDLTPDEIAAGIGYTIIGRGMKSTKTQQMEKEAIQMFPDNKKYQEVENIINEKYKTGRVLTSMEGSSEVSVKDKCKLGGGTTCNRGDIENFNIKKINEEKEETKGCLMFFLNIPNWNKITSIINKEDVYEKEGFGIETEPHTTILYGFSPEIKSNEVFDLLKKKVKLKPFKIKVSGISVFENKDFDVVKFDINSKTLNYLNKLSKELPYKNDYPDYHPHITIAYVKSGEGKKYIKKFDKEHEFSGNELVYSLGKGNQERLELN